MGVENEALYFRAGFYRLFCVVVGLAGNFFV
jgi:hypothetical protein